ncbi:hypothetical protein [Pararcticibacter amylolyticus]|uniref:hypothetical protein n=1 Tax=Pararcticibacter amylolyticus TaxID=2173175 RepID=UPI0011B293A1|nr:hypothetical protein [Pararcticibacter amylolyticus]
MPGKKTSPGDLNNTINLFLKELPDPTTCMQTAFRKELSVNDRKVILLAQQIKGANGMAWNVNVT